MSNNEFAQYTPIKLKNSFQSVAHFHAYEFLHIRSRSCTLHRMCTFRRKHSHHKGKLIKALQSGETRVP